VSANSLTRLISVASGIVAVIALAGFKDSIIAQPLTHLKAIDQTWRTIIGVGCVPAVIALYFRLTIPETPRYTIDVENDLAQATLDAQTNWGKNEGAVQAPAAEKVVTPKHSWTDFWRHFGQWKNGKVLFGTAWSWFALDVAFYGLGLNSSIILQTIGFGKYTGSANKSENIFRTLHNVAVGNLVLAVGGLIPGYYFTFFFVDKWGRKKIQVSSRAVYFANSS